MTCRVCKKPIRFWQEDITDKHGERYHLECYLDVSGFIEWESKTDH